MAKSTKQKARVITPGKAFRAGAKPTAEGDNEPAHEEDHIDGCACEIHESDATPDSELPPAKGGVAIIQGKRQKVATAHPDNDIDGCDVEVLESEATPDPALPSAKGGVALARGRRLVTGR